jgi:hypothetical protein
MIVRLGSVTLVLAVLLACTPPPEAPSELNDLTRYLYRTQADPDDAVVKAGLDNLQLFLADKDLSGDASVNDRSWALDDLREEDVADLERPDRDLALEIGLSVARESQWPPEDHARAQSETDQRPFEPTAKDLYERSFPNEPDPACFVARTCTLLESFNHATRKNVLMDVTFELWKDFRWVALDDDRHAIIARSWFKEPWPGADGDIILQQSNALDIWLGQDDGTTWRFQALWSETEGLAVSDDIILGTVKLATDDIFETGDEQIGELYHPSAN